MKRMSYEQIRPKLNTGDIILFRGKGRLSRWIRWVCSMFTRRITWASHIGVIIKKGDNIAVLESTTMDGSKGVRCEYLSNILGRYKGEVMVRHLNVVRPDWFNCAAENFAKKHLGKPYQRNLFELIRAAWTININRKETPDDLFCSELVAMFYQHYGYLSMEPRANNYTPEDFRAGGVVDKMIADSMLNASLGEEWIIDVSDKSDIEDDPTMTATSPLKENEI